MTVTVTVRAPAPGDLDRVLALLREADLPPDGVEGAFDRFLVATVGAGTVIAGAIGIEDFGDDVLLRSLVVAVQERGTGIGSTLVHQILASATAGGARRAWLLTETAAPFLARFGFEVVDRVSAPLAVQGSVEFREACPASATCMMRALTGEFWESGSAASQRRDVTDL